MGGDVWAAPAIRTVQRREWLTSEAPAPDPETGPSAIQIQTVDFEAPTDEDVGMLIQGLIKVYVPAAETQETRNANGTRPATHQVIPGINPRGDLNESFTYMKPSTEIREK